jgi:hypothetical protein
MSNKVSIRCLWIATVAILLLAALQALSGNWIVYFYFWPGGAFYGSSLVRLVLWLAKYHITTGFIVGGLSIIVLVFAFISKSGLWVRIFAAAGLIMVGLAASGGIGFVTSGFQDRMSLGRMADAFVGVFAAYFFQLFFMKVQPSFPWWRRPGED